jgi:hypothetical protein
MARLDQRSEKYFAGENVTPGLNSEREAKTWGAKNEFHFFAPLFLPYEFHTTGTYAGW